MTKSPTVQSSGASLSAAASGGVAPRSLSMRAGAPSRLSARTIVETAACPPELKRGEQSWAFSDFKVQKSLGEGAMSSVVHCVCVRSGVHTAIKMYHKDRMNAMNVKQVTREINIHASLLHPNVVRLFAAFEDGDGIYLVQEYASRGDLYVELSRRGGYMPEPHVVKSVLIPFLSALTYMHTQGVLHRDIKPENIMLSGEGEIKVGDFGLAIDTTREKPMSRVGTLDYMPPEIVRLPHGGSALSATSKLGAEEGAAYGLPADAWCVGVLAYELLVGAPPFEAESKDATYTRILKLEPSIPSHLSDQARGFIAAALKKDPSQRPSVHQLLRHPWLRTYQRPKSMAVLETPCKAQLSGSALQDLPAGRPMAAAAHSEEQGETPQASNASITAPAATPSPAVVAAAAGAGAGRAAGLKSLSFSSAMAGRFTSVKPSKPSPFNLLSRRKDSSGSADDSATTTMSNSAAKGPANRSQLAAAREMSAAAAVAEVDAERAPAAGEPGLAPGAGKAAAGKQGAIHVQAVSGVTSASGEPAAAASTPGQPGTEELIPAAAHSAASSSPRGSFAAAIKRKLSSMGSGMFGAAGAEASADEAAEAEAAARGMGAIAALQAPSMQQLLSPQPAAAQPMGPLKRTSSGRRFLSAIGRKWSLGGRKDSLASSLRA
ncbi:hypothetical protein D9Q98_000916 [Chlorella vulgaris]|uniref:Protein kinase domain-containing protein n=1 Tax=Chlorella vulgaris TaxID=3077 RepID=A0A9D4Z1M5_CHLVU|nr:hypothetical protein D9Q98_000916 [Chlorella vulgaris]